MNRLIATGVELPYENRAVLSHLEIPPLLVVRVWWNRLLAMEDKDQTLLKVSHAFPVKFQHTISDRIISGPPTFWETC